MYSLLRVLADMEVMVMMMRMAAEREGGGGGAVGDGMHGGVDKLRKKSHDPISSRKIQLIYDVVMSTCSFISQVICTFFFWCMHQKN